MHIIKEYEGIENDANEVTNALDLVEQTADDLATAIHTAQTDDDLNAAKKLAGDIEQQIDEARIAWQKMLDLLDDPQVADALREAERGQWVTLRDVPPGAVVELKRQRGDLWRVGHTQKWMVDGEETYLNLVLLVPYGDDADRLCYVSLDTRCILTGQTVPISFLDAEGEPL